MEGAGSCCEVNLREHDLVNFEMALMTQTPAIIVADIDRGGIFAQIVGSMEIITPAERDLVAGFIINKFRGDPTLFQSGIDYIEQKTGKPVFGLVPYYEGFQIDTEDSMSLDQSLSYDPPQGGRINIAVIRLPHVSNFTDLEVLAAEPDVLLNWLERPTGLASYDAVIIPGSKNVIHDATWIQKSEWPIFLKQFSTDLGKTVIGLCGGFQLLGKTISDPHGVEGNQKNVEGLGLLNITTTLAPEKTVQRTQGRESLFDTIVSGYEIHMGQSERGDGQAPFLELAHGPEGAVSTSGNVIGTYLHGLFDAGAFRSRLLARLAAAKGMPISANFQRRDHWLVKEQHYDRLADHFERHLDIKRILSVMDLN
jgi:adenosylcobyric acid synthase